MHRFSELPQSELRAEGNRDDVLSCKSHSCVSPGPKSRRSLLSRRAAPSARRCRTLRTTRPAYCIGSPRLSSSATGLCVPLVTTSRQNAGVRHPTCCLSRRRLQNRVLMASAVFSLLIPSHSQLRLSAARSPCMINLGRRLGGHEGGPKKPELCERWVNTIA